MTKFQLPVKVILDLYENQSDGLYEHVKALKLCFPSEINRDKFSMLHNTYCIISIFNKCKVIISVSTEVLFYFEHVIAILFIL